MGTDLPMIEMYKSFLSNNINKKWFVLAISLPKVFIQPPFYRSWHSLKCTSRQWNCGGSPPALEVLRIKENKIFEKKKNNGMCLKTFSCEFLIRSIWIFLTTSCWWFCLHNDRVWRWFTCLGSSTFPVETSLKDHNWLLLEITQEHLLCAWEKKNLFLHSHPVPGTSFRCVPGISS